jgi:hypothetical protein
MGMPAAIVPSIFYCHLLSEDLRIIMCKTVVLPLVLNGSLSLILRAGKYFGLRVKKQKNIV